MLASPGGQLLVTAYLEIGTVKRPVKGPFAVRSQCLRLARQLHLSSSEQHNFRDGPYEDRRERCFPASDCGHAAHRIAFTNLRQLRPWPVLLLPGMPVGNEESAAVRRHNSRRRSKYRADHVGGSCLWPNTGRCMTCGARASGLIPFSGPVPANDGAAGFKKALYAITGGLRDSSERRGCGSRTLPRLEC